MRLETFRRLQQARSEYHQPRAAASRTPTGKDLDEELEAEIDDEEDDDEEEEEADELLEALTLLKAAHGALRGVSWVDGAKDFLTPRGLQDVESLIGKIDEVLEQYDLDDEVSEVMFDSVVGLNEGEG